MDEELRNYLQQIVAHNQAERRLKINHIENKIDTEKNKKVVAAIISGICGVAALVVFNKYGYAIPGAMNGAIDSLVSFPTFKEYMDSLNPDLIQGLGIGAASYAGVYGGFISFVKHFIKQKQAQSDLNEMNQSYNELEEYSGTGPQIGSR